MRSAEERGRARLRGLLLALVMGGSLFAGFGLADAGPQPQSARLVDSRGTVRVRPNGDSRWLTASRRMRLSEGDALRTGSGAYAIIEFSPRNYVRLGANTEFEVERSVVRREVDPDGGILFFTTLRDAYEVEVDLPQGEAVSMLRGLRGSSTYRMNTPVAAAGVRGTVFYAGVENPESEISAAARSDISILGQVPGAGPSASFAVLEGSVNVTGVPGMGVPVLPMTLGAGQGIVLQGQIGAPSLPPSAPPPPPAPPAPSVVSTMTAAANQMQTIIQTAESSVTDIDAIQNQVEQEYESGGGSY